MVAQFKPDIAQLDLTREQFTAQITEEFIQGSAIAPTLFTASVQVVSDVELLPGGEVSTPLHDALGWRYTRFGHKAKSSLFGALLLNEDGSTWQAKLSQPRTDKTKRDRIIKYETGVGNGSRAFLPAIDLQTWLKVAQRHHVVGFLPTWVTAAIDQGQTGLHSHPDPRLTPDQIEHYAIRLKQAALSSSRSTPSPLRESEQITAQFPIETTSFWDWVGLLECIDIVLTEGGKKALSLLSQGYVAIALYGANGGYRKVGELRELTADVARFAVPGRTITLAFDQDIKQTARHRVTVALYRFGALLRNAGCPVAIAIWDKAQGKGVDDLIVAGGAEAFDQVYAQALSLEHWQIQQRLSNRLTYPASLKLTTADLSTLDLSDLPLQGMIALLSAKATGKTKGIGKWIQGVEKVLAAGHRIALMRNLSHRLHLDYRGDVDKVNGEYINGASYTLRIGFCVDSLLAIDPNKFAECDLILDEVVQVVRHLLTSSTCSREGKRPALLARFRELLQTARRVIIADADLDNATLHYIHQLRGDSDPAFLIRNDYTPPGYPVRFFDAPDRSSITTQLLEDIQMLDPEQSVYVATDSKATSKAIARLIEQQAPTKRVLLINSETSGGELERSFMANPDDCLSDWDVILCSPSAATGISLEKQGVIQRVYGIFSGVSSTDADIAQSLGRVREPVERVVWCAKRGSNFSKVSRSTNPIELKSHLQQASSATVRLVRSNLREDIAGDLAEYDWQSDPHLNLYAHFSAEQNRSMMHLRDALLVRLKHEGNSVTVESWAADPTMKLLLRQAREEQRQIDAEELVAADDLTYAQILELEQKESVSPEEHLAIAKHYLKDFYCLDSITLEEVIWDNEGRRRGELLNLEAQLFPGLASDRTVKALERQAQWGQGYCPWDVSTAELRRVLREKLKLNEIIEKMQHGWEWCKYDLAPYAAIAREFIPQIKVALNFTITDRVSDTQIVHQLLSQLGIKIAKPRWSCFVEGYEGEKLRVYRLDRAVWDTTWAILERRQAKWLSLSQQQTSEESGSPHAFNNLNDGGDLLEVTAAAEYLKESLEHGKEAVLAVLKPWSLAFRESVLAVLRQQSEAIIERFETVLNFV
ncbi:DUF3854 domain-containing protein [Oculatella sp. LEGE 06141]|uniref:plasmid replication protein, CyRepA1 family n=1 Tax=Oculatella sp. LEGE 06141 TaxID=1828648 RepID=UPI0018815CB3|nr:plasmid replication protein, CyRepA1 family [Oculatella sp. LEGE 06141]MBE9182466.1 DUF3854 domain-containing protein [Oculatella sp. LEGE 06141]